MSVIKGAGGRNDRQEANRCTFIRYTRIRVVKGIYIMRNVSCPAVFSSLMMTDSYIMSFFKLFLLHFSHLSTNIVPPAFNCTLARFRNIAMWLGAGAHNGFNVISVILQVITHRSQSNEQLLSQVSIAESLLNSVVENDVITLKQL